MNILITVLIIEVIAYFLLVYDVVDNDFSFEAQFIHPFVWFLICLVIAIPRLPQSIYKFVKGLHAKYIYFKTGKYPAVILDKKSKLWRYFNS